MKKFIVTAVFALALTLTGGSVAEAVFTWTPGQALLRVGSEGAQVMELQKCLAELGNNPSYNVDGKFGPITASAVRNFQAQYNIDNPGSPIYVDGIIGAQTGPLYVAACADAMDMDDDSDDEDMDDDSSELRGGEASLEDFDLESEDDAEEGEMKHVATASFDVEDGDILINRVDVTFNSGSVTSSADTDPWDVFETITLMIDGDEVAEEDVDDEDDWLDDTGAVTSFRLSDIDYVAEEDEEVEIEIYLTAQNNIDAPGTDATWIISVENNSIRAVDSEGIQNYIGGADTVTFDVEAEGGDEEVVIKSSSSDPDSFVIEVDETDDSAWEEVFVFSLEAEENDIELDTIGVTVTTGAANYEDVVEDIKLEIDGKEFDDVTVTDGNSTTADLSFDIDEEYTIDADETVKVSVWVEIKQQGDGDGIVTGDADDNYNVGETIMVTATSVTGEGADDVSDTASIAGEKHTLEIAVADIDFDGFSVDKAEDDASGTISFQFTIDASDSEDDIDFNVANKAAVNGSTDDVMFTLSGTDTGIASATITLLDGDATADASGWVIDEGGEAATFVVDVTFTTVDAGDNGTYRVKLDEVEGVEIDEISSGMTLSF